MSRILPTTSLRARLKNQIHCRSRREEAQIFRRFGRESEPPHVGSYNFKTTGLAVAGGLLRETVPLAQRFSDDRLVAAPAVHPRRRALSVRIRHMAWAAAAKKWLRSGH